MYGENHGKPYEQMDDLGVSKPPIFGSTPKSATAQVLSIDSQIYVYLQPRWPNLRLHTWVEIHHDHIAGWNIPIFNRKCIDSIRGPHFPASYVR